MMAESYKLYQDTEKDRRTSRDAPTGHKLFKFISFSFQSRRWAHIKRWAEANTMRDDPTHYSVFSYNWFFVAFLLHLIITAVLGGLAFVTGMGSFTGDVGFAMSVWKVILWIWTPLAVAYGGSPLHAIIWSLLVGVAVGFGAPRFRR